VLFTIAADLTRMQVEVDVDESDVGPLQTGTRASFEVAAYPDDRFEGLVTQMRVQPVAEQTAAATMVGLSSIGPAASSEVPTVVGYAAMLAVDNRDEKLRPGMTATVTLEGAHRPKALRLPNAALSFRPSADMLAVSASDADATPPAAGDTQVRRVWLYDGTHFFFEDVHVGIADTDYTEVVSGALHPGDRVVTNATVVGGRL
jgi:HlyD family secretion protein